MADFGDFLSGAGTGAMAGSSFGPWGTAIGAVGGGLLGMFTPKAPQLQTFTNPYQGQIDAGINRLMSSRVGAQMAQNAAAGYRRDARAAFDTMQQNPAVSGNASVMSALYNRTQDSAANAITNANVQGAGLDLRSQQAGLQAAMGANAQSMAQTQYNNYVQQMNNRPGPLQQMLMQGIGQLAGRGIANLVGGQNLGQTGNDSSQGFQMTQSSLPMPSAPRMQMPGFSSPGIGLQGSGFGQLQSSDYNNFTGGTPGPYGSGSQYYWGQ